MSAAAPRATNISDAQARFAARVDNAALAFARVWTLPLLLLGALYSGLPLLAPVLRAHGHRVAARVIYAAYRLVCHQKPQRSFHLDGQKMAFCERDLAIYGTATLCVLVYSFVRLRWRPAPLRWRWALLCALPMALDGGTQLVGLRESTWELRVVTGALFSLGMSCLALPHLERGFADVRAAIMARQGA